MTTEFQHARPHGEEARVARRLEPWQQIRTRGHPSRRPRFPRAPQDEVEVVERSTASQNEGGRGPRKPQTKSQNHCAEELVQSGPGHESRKKNGRLIQWPDLQAMINPTRVIRAGITHEHPDKIIRRLCDPGVFDPATAAVWAGCRS